MPDLMASVFKHVTGVNENVDQKWLHWLSLLLHPINPEISQSYYHSFEFKRAR